MSILDDELTYLTIPTHLDGTINSINFDPQVKITGVNSDVELLDHKDSIGQISRAHSGVIGESNLDQSPIDYQTETKMTLPLQQHPPSPRKLWE